MTGSLAAFFFAFLLSVVLTNAVRLTASAFGWVDHPDHFRKLHKYPVPRLGGIGIYIAFLIPMAALYFASPNHPFMVQLQDRASAMAGMLIGSAIALGMGVADDFRNIRPATKLLFQIVAGAVAWKAGLSISIISNPFGAPIVLGWLSLPVTVFWFVACMNAVNLMDGLDGLAAGVCLFITVTLFLVSLHFLNVIGMILMACLSGAIFGFLLFNFHPAKIFLGDSGTMVLGFLIAALSLIGTTRKAETAIALLIPIVAMGLPILDTSLSIMRRWYKRLPISSPDRQHIHHVLLSMGYSQRRAVFVLYLATLVFGAAALLITIGRSEVTILVLGSLFLITFVCIRIFGGMKIEDLFARFTKAQDERRLAVAARVAVERAVQQMPRALSLGGLWDICTEALYEMGLDRAMLTVKRADSGTTETLAWKNDLGGSPGVSGPDADWWRGSLTIANEGRIYGRLEIAKDISGEIPIPEVPTLTEVLRQALVIHLPRILAGDAQGAAQSSAADTIAQSASADSDLPT